jgi:hypothetical protein
MVMGIIQDLYLSMLGFGHRTLCLKIDDRYLTFTTG